MAWGDADFGGDCSAVRDQLKNVQQIQASGGGFAAVLADGNVVTWGHADPRAVLCFISSGICRLIVAADFLHYFRNLPLTIATDLGDGPGLSSRNYSN